MNRFRDNILSPSSQGPEDTPGANSIADDQEFVRWWIAHGGRDEIRGYALENRTGVATLSYCEAGDSVNSIVGYVRQIWHSYYELSRYTPHESPEHDRLVLDILRIQGRGPLTRLAAGNSELDIARTIEGVVWNDTPFLVTDMTEAWIADAASMSGTQRLNFSSFLAKLASTRLSKDRMCQIAIILFRHAFEHPQEVYPFDDPDDESTHRTLEDLQLQQLLPSVLSWIKEATRFLGSIAPAPLAMVAHCL